MATFVQELTDRILDQAGRDNPGVPYSVHLSHENALLLPRTGTTWDCGGFRIEGRQVYRDCLVLPLSGDTVGDTIQAVPVHGLDGDADAAFSYVGELDTGEVQTVFVAAAGR